jgi:putative MATE family efflux protein
MEIACLKECPAPVVVSPDCYAGVEAPDVAILINGSPWSIIWHMCWPLTLNMLALAAMNLFEGWIAARLGANAQAAMGIGGQLWFLFMMMTLALSAGSTAVVSRFCGAGEIESAVQAGRQALLCALALSAGATVFGLLTCRMVLHALGASAMVEDQGVVYLNMCLISMVPYTALWITNSIFRASGDAYTPMLTMLLVFGLIMLCEFALCIGPAQMGVQGIGISWIVCSVFGVVLNFVRLKNSSLDGVCDWRAVLREGLSLSWAKRFLIVGVPSCIQDLALIGGSLGVFLVLSKTPQPLIAQAAWAAGWRLEETLTLMPMYGLNLAAAAIVGQNLGAGKAKRAASCGWRVMSVGAAVNIFVALAMLIQAPHIAALLCANDAVASSCTDYIRIVCWTEPLFACWRILSGAMQGAGYTFVPMFATVLSFAILRISLAALSLHLSHGNSIGVWASMAASTVVAGLMMIYFWHRGDWQSQRI